MTPKPSPAVASMLDLFQVFTVSISNHIQMISKVSSSQLVISQSMEDSKSGHRVPWWGTNSRKQMLKSMQEVK